MRPASLVLLSFLGLACDPAGSSSLGGSPGPSPRLTSLALSGLELTPAFDPSIHDYAVRCEPDLTPTTLRALASGGAPVRVEWPAGMELDTPVELQEGTLVVLATGTGAASARTFVRCLPHDLPRLQVTLHPEHGAPTPGWYLLGNTVVGSSGASYAMVLDGHGTPIWYQKMGGAMDVDALAPNVLGLTPYLAARADDTGTFTELHLDTDQARSVPSAPGLPLDPHELQLLPDGTRLGLAMPLVPHVDLTGLFTSGSDATLLDCALEVRDGDGGLLWSWRASEHFDPVRETTVDYPVTVGGVPVADVFHCNSAEDDHQGGFIVSARHLDAVFRVDRASGRVSWKLGGAPVNRDGARLVRVVDDPQGGFFRQHDARLTADGHLSLFDDESLRAGPARAVEYALDLDAGTATLVYGYAGPQPSAAMGSYRRLADGSRVVGWGWMQDTLALTEVGADGAPMLELRFTDGSHAYRALKVPAPMLSADLLRQF